MNLKINDKIYYNLHKSETFVWNFLSLVVLINTFYVVYVIPNEGKCFPIRYIMFYGK